MRQRRQRLQVSTFPFLAVLLCAMGSLILLLLVIDRRAKVVARVKAMRAMGHALALSSADDERDAAAHRAEWERRRQMLHERLLQQDQQILGELQTVESRAAAAAGSVQAEKAQSRDLHEQLQAERLGLVRSEDELSARRAEMENRARQADASRAELAGLTVELERMERTLADLKAVRQRQQQMYSLVPYRGKRGDNRKPIYLECSGDELIFHPDRLALRGLTLIPSGIRDEVERRLKAIHEKPEENAYLLMLIRPNGITTYYQILAALKGLRMDFGYEFIDQDWILDFSEDQNAPQKQPWLAADQTKERSPSGFSVKDDQASGRTVAGHAQKRYQGLSSGGIVQGRPMGIVSSDSSGPSDGSFGSGGGGAGRQGDSGTVTAGNPGTGAQPVALQSGAGSPVPGTRDGNGPAFAEVLAGGGRSSAAQGTSLDGNLTVAGRQPLDQPKPPDAPGRAAEGADIGQAVSGGQRGTTDPPLDSRAVRSNGIGERQMEGSPGGSSKPGIDGPPSLLPSFAPNGPRAAASSGMDGSPQPVAEGGNRGSLGQPGSGEPLRGPPGDSLDRFAPQNPPNKPVRAIPFRPGLLIGNRDWIIAIECTADALVLRPSGQRIATAELSSGESRNNPLLETVQRMIAHRQATVRPGDPPYRPMIRFRVWPEGLRSYYLAYPALEPLHVPMSRENLDPEP